MYRVVRYSLKLSEAPRLLIAKSLSPLITYVIQIMKGTKASRKEERKKWFWNSYMFTFKTNRSIKIERERGREIERERERAMRVA